MKTLLVFGVAHRDFATAIAAQCSCDVVLEDRSLALKLKLLRRRALRYGARRVAGQLARRIVAQACREPSSYSGHRAGKATSALNPRAVVPDVNNGVLAELLTSMEPQRVFVYGTSIFGRQLVALLPDQAVNVHTGLTQHYRGVFANFWALHDDAPERVGYTVHRLTAGIDTGHVLEQRFFNRQEILSCESLQAVDQMVARAAESRLLELACNRQRLEGGQRLKQKGRLMTEPTLWEYRKAEKRFRAFLRSKT